LVSTDCTELDELIEERDEIAMRLEDAEVTLIKLADKARVKAGGSGPTKVEAAGEPEGASGSVAAQWLSTKQRPTHRLKPIIGEKVVLLFSFFFSAVRQSRVNNITG
jgi:hypothetical protein